MPRQMSLEDLKQIDLSPRVDFHYRLIQFLRQELPEETSRMDDPVLLERIRESERRGARYGVESEAGISQWVCLTFLAGPDFDDMPEVKSYLMEPQLSPDEKMEELVSCIEEELG